MPELPEVETMVRGLRPALEGRRLASAELHDPSMLLGCTSEELAARCVGAVVSGVGRRGKWVVVELADAGLIVIQPRMTGGFRLVEPDRPGHVRLTFRLASPDASIWFCDARRLGRILWFDGPEQADAAFARAHGPDALAIGRDDLAARLKRTRRAVKPALMDQKVLAGIGNIYADEILFESRLHPTRVSAELRPAEVDRLHAAIRPVLTRAIEAEGASFDAGYRTVLGLEGGFLAVNSMYGRAGRPCKGCGAPILKTKIPGLIGRPTYLCPACQPEKRPRARRDA
ncbi:bifunctional DNA-formamidopyrimidine glycosylase/DNA-(apurinic or apyrimidinic site) lyase [Paludisphaera sp.]|uniref:bifunctional DNA-formamidopyrimidine glycosylase/DNA-(apurinic or apyrimidinic site) lyase n=1 Tax=Paludisphaera sp. TaxID=2017432 RepID=UPI00301BC98A